MHGRYLPSEIMQAQARGWGWGAVVEIVAPGIGRESYIMTLLCPWTMQSGCHSDAPTVGARPICRSFEAPDGSCHTRPCEGGAAGAGKSNADKCCLPMHATRTVCLLAHTSTCQGELSTALCRRGRCLATHQLHSRTGRILKYSRTLLSKTKEHNIVFICRCLPHFPRSLTPPSPLPLTEIPARQPGFTSVRVIVKELDAATPETFEIFSITHG